MKKLLLLGSILLTSSLAYADSTRFNPKISLEEEDCSVNEIFKNTYTDSYGTDVSALHKNLKGKLDLGKIESISSKSYGELCITVQNLITDSSGKDEYKDWSRTEQDTECKNVKIQEDGSFVIDKFNVDLNAKLRASEVNLHTSLSYKMYIAGEEVSFKGCSVDEINRDPKKVVGLGISELDYTVKGLTLNH